MLGYTLMTAFCVCLVLCAQIRNFGGGAWNHDLWWATLAPYNSTDTDPNTSLSPELSGALNSSFGGVSPFLDQVL